MLNESSESKPAFLMQESSLHQYFIELLDMAGINPSGQQPWDLQLNAFNVPERVFAEGNLGLGISYMAGDWDVKHLDEFFYRLLRARLPDKIKPSQMVFHALKVKLFNRQTQKRAWQVGEQHYDLGNNFYAAMLDKRMTYTCGYWKNATNLDQAQEAKLDLICRKIGLQPGMKVLDIGCGWGSFMRYATEHYGVECIGLTISKEQANWVNKFNANLPVHARLQDYRDINEPFDRIVSIGMFEHVGRKNYRTFMQVAHRCLKNGGLFLLHTIGKNERRGHTDPWIDKYIFPNGELPALCQITNAAEPYFVVEDLHNFGADYDKTLMAWNENFEKSWPQFSEQLGPRFYRMWRYYLLSCAGAFRARDIQLWQWVFSKQAIEGGYQRVS